MNCPICQQKTHIDALKEYRCINQLCGFYGYVINFVNPDDIKEDFWGTTYLIRLTRFRCPYVVNAEHEQAAIDEMIDYIEAHKWEGLLLDQNDADDLEMIETGDYISGGNHGRYLSTYHIQITTV